MAAEDRPGCPGPAQGGLSTLTVVVLCAVGLCVVSSVVAAIALPGLVQTEWVDNESAAIGALKTIGTAQTMFRETDKEGDGTLDYGSLRELSDVQVIDAVLGGGQRQGYRFQAAASPTTPGSLWMAVASPTAPGTTGDRYFVTNHAGVIYYSPTTPFSITPDCAIPAHALPLGR